MRSGHFLNTPETLVLDSLKGLCVLNPQLAIDEDNKIVYQRSRDLSKVALICGGGSGHEPAHAGYVGRGMLTCAVSGNVFASPNPSQIIGALDLVDNDNGVVIIVKNYTGDVLNFGLAKERFSELHPEKSDRIKLLVVGDDVAVGREQGKLVGRRGLAGTVLVYKIAGALANRGSTVDEIHSLATWIAARLATIGVSLGHTSVPGVKANKLDPPSSGIEIGMGIHNEAGHTRLSPVPKLSELISQILSLLTSTTDPDRSFVPFRGKDNVVLLVNNLGGVSDLELSAIVYEIKAGLDKRQFTTARILVGTYMTSLSMPGFSVTLLLLPNENETDGLSTDLVLDLLDEKPDNFAWKPAVLPDLVDNNLSLERERVDWTKATITRVKFHDPKAFTEKVKKAAQALISAEPEITRLDVIVGDGDCGLTLKAGAEALLAKLDMGDISGDDIVGCIITVSRIAEETMGGTSGALYSIFFSALAKGILDNGENGEVTRGTWGKALASARDKLYTYTRARRPSRTLVDPLDAFVDTFLKSKGECAASVSAAIEAVEATRYMAANVGRTAYIAKDVLETERVPDPGAWGVKVILESL